MKRGFTRFLSTRPLRPNDTNSYQIIFSNSLSGNKTVDNTTTIQMIWAYVEVTAELVKHEGTDKGGLLMKIVPN